MTRGHRGSLLLRCRALSSPSPCRFIPALETCRYVVGVAQGVGLAHGAQAGEGTDWHTSTAYYGEARDRLLDTVSQQHYIDTLMPKRLYWSILKA